MAEQWALVSDFDGTVSADDFSLWQPGAILPMKCLNPGANIFPAAKNILTL